MCSRNAASNNVLGGEQSGHVIFSDDSPAGWFADGGEDRAGFDKRRLESLITGLRLSADYRECEGEIEAATGVLPRVSRALAEHNRRSGQWRVVLRYSGRNRWPRDGRSGARCGRPTLRQSAGRRVARIHRGLSSRDVVFFRNAPSAFQPTNLRDRITVSHRCNSRVSPKEWM